MFDFDAPAGAAASSRPIAAKYGAGIINSQTPAFYNATKILFEAIRRAGTVDDTTKVRDAVEKIEGYDAGIYGPVQAGPAWKSTASTISSRCRSIVVEVKDGKAVHRATLQVD